MLMRWWKAHGWPGVSKAILPKLGLIIENNGKPVIAGFVYMDNSVGVAFIEWVVSNPSAGKKEMLACLGILFDFAEQRLKQLGYGLLLSSCSEQIKSLYEKFGMVDAGGPPHYHLYKILK